MRVEIAEEAAAFVRANGGSLWVWSARPRGCCAGTPAFVHAATVPPVLERPFRRIDVQEFVLWFVPPAGRPPEVLEIGMHGRRHPKVEAYWDGSLIAL
jgi:hypothetical protein